LQEHLAGAKADIEAVPRAPGGSFELAEVSHRVGEAPGCEACVGALPANVCASGGPGERFVQQCELVVKLSSVRCGQGEQPRCQGGERFTLCGVLQRHGRSLSIPQGRKEFGAHDSPVQGGHRFDDGCECRFGRVLGEEVELCDSQGEIRVSGCSLQCRYVGRTRVLQAIREERLVPMARTTWAGGALSFADGLAINRIPSVVCSHAM
jgi:hypothetical protein